MASSRIRTDSPENFSILVDQATFLQNLEDMNISRENSQILFNRLAVISKKRQLPDAVSPGPLKRIRECFGERSRSSPILEKDSGKFECIDHVDDDEDIIDQEGFAPTEDEEVPTYIDLVDEDEDSIDQEEFLPTEDEEEFVPTEDEEEFVPTEDEEVISTEEDVDEDIIFTEKDVDQEVINIEDDDDFKEVINIADDDDVKEVICIEDDDKKDGGGGWLTNDEHQENSNENCSTKPTELPESLKKKVKNMSKSEIEQLENHILTDMVRLHQRLYEEVKSVARKLVHVVVKSIAKRRSGKPLCFFIKALPQSGKTAIKTFLASTAHLIHAYSELEARPYTVLLGQFKGLIENVAANMKPAIKRVSGRPNFQYITFTSREVDKAELIAQTGGMIVNSKTRLATIEPMIDMIRRLNKSHVPLLLVDESDAFAVGLREFKFNQVYSELQRACSGIVCVTATMFHSLIDISLQPYATFGSFVNASRPLTYVGVEALKPWRGEVIEEGLKAEQIVEKNKDFIREAIVDYSLLIASVASRVRVGYTGVDVVRDIATHIPDKSFIAIVIHGGGTPFKGGMGIGAFGQKSALWMYSLQKKVDEIDSFDESEPGFISAGRLRGWLGDIELEHSPKNRYKLLNDKNVALKHLTILLTALRVTFGIKTPIVVSGFSMLRRSLSIVGYSIRSGPVAAPTHFLTLPSKQQPSNEILQHLARMAGTATVKNFRQNYHFSEVQCLTTKRAWDGLEMELALEKYGGRRVAESIMKVRAKMESEGLYDFTQVNFQATLKSLADRVFTEYPKLRDKFPITPPDILPFPRRLNIAGINIFEKFVELGRGSDETPKHRRVSSAKVPRELKMFAFESALYLIYAMRMKDYPDEPQKVFESFKMNDTRKAFVHASDKEYRNSPVNVLLRKLVEEYENQMEEAMKKDNRYHTDKHDELYLDFGLATSLEVISWDVVGYSNKRSAMPPRLKSGYGVELAETSTEKKPETSTEKKHLVWRFTKERVKELEARYKKETSIDSMNHRPYELPRHAQEAKSKHSSRKKRQA